MPRPEQINPILPRVTTIREFSDEAMGRLTEKVKQYGEVGTETCMGVVVPMTDQELRDWEESQHKTIAPASRILTRDAFFDVCEHAANAVSGGEVDPTGKSPSEPGAKLDSGKIQAGCFDDFGPAILEIMKVCSHGAEKYSRGGWKQVPNAIQRYTDAQRRHLMDRVARGETFDRLSGLYHEAHEIWNALAVFTLKLRQTDEYSEDAPCKK